MLSKKNISLFVLLFILVQGMLLACSVPVFRYALERWAPDIYEVVVFHKDPLKPQEKETVSFLEETCKKYNLSLSIVDLAAEAEPSIQQLWEKQSGATLPWMVLRYPKIWRSDIDVWSGPLSLNTVKKLAYSPLRKEIGNRILEDDSAVWLLIESGDAQKDDAAASRLQDALDKMEDILELPFAFTQTLGPDAANEMPISFSMVRLEREDPAEEFFFDMLMNIDPYLKEQPEPIAFAIFGRGRVLYALLGDEINERDIETGCRYLLEACSCQVKMENPGGDLLMPIDWDMKVIGDYVFDVTFPPLAGFSDFSEAEKDINETTAAERVDEKADLATEKTESATSKEGTEKQNLALIRNVGIVFAAAVAIILISTLFLKKKKSAG